MEKDTTVHWMLIILLSVFAVVSIIKGIGYSNKIAKQADEIEALNEKIYSYEDYEYDYQDEIDQLEEENESLAHENYELFEQMVDMGVDYEFFWEYAGCVNENGSFYHHPSCDNFSDEYFYIYNVDLAESYGYKPCPVCW